MNDSVPKAAGVVRRRRRGGRGRAGTKAKPADELPDVPFPEAEPVFAVPHSFVPASNFIDGMGTPPPAGAMNQEEQILALFIDIDNLLIGLRETGHPKFDVKLLISRLLEKGKIVVKRAYADWSRYTEYKRAFHESAFELIDIPQHRMTGQELGGHPDGRGRDGPRLEQGAHHDVRHRLGRLGLSRRSSRS